MAQVNINWQVSQYTSDFGNTYNDIPFKAGGDMPDNIFEPLTGLEMRDEGVISCGAASLPFEMRHLRITFDDGSIHKVPVPNKTLLQTYVNHFRNFEEKSAICQDLIGERWNIVPGTLLNDPDFANPIYTNIQERSLRTRVSYNYDSDVQTSTLSLTTSIESLPQELYDCQSACLTNPQQVDASICSGQSLGIKPRRYIIQALRGEIASGPPDQDGNLPTVSNGRVIRQAIISTRVAAQIISCASELADCSHCLGYRGEDYPRVDVVITQASEEPTAGGGL